MSDEPQISLTVRDGETELTVFGAARLLPALLDALTGGGPVADPRTGMVTSYPYPLEARARRQAEVARARWHGATPESADAD